MTSAHCYREAARDRRTASARPALWTAAALAAALLLVAVLGRQAAVSGLPIAAPSPAHGRAGAEAAEERYPDAFLREPRLADPQNAPSAPPPAPPEPPEPAPAHAACEGAEDRMPETVTALTSEGPVLVEVIPREWARVAGWCGDAAEAWLAPGAGGPEALRLLDDVLAVMYCESRGYQGRDNRGQPDPTGEYPVGLMQVSSGWLAGSRWARARELTLPAEFDRASLYDGRKNLEAARIIWGHFGGWSQWACRP